MITTAETYKQKGIQQYKAKQYEEAISTFDQAITLGDRSVFIYDMKISSLSKADMVKKRVGDPEFQSQALHAVDAVIKKFEKHSEVWKLYYRRADILYRMSTLTLALGTLDKGLKVIEKLPTKERLAARHALTTLRDQIAEKMARHRNREIKSKANAAQLLAEETSRRSRFAELLRTNHFATALPPEILYIICQYGQQTDCAMNVRMAGVCHAWRNVITSRPALWQELKLGGRFAVRKAELWAKYCGGSLSEVLYEDNFRMENVEGVRMALELFVPSIRRLELRALPVVLPSQWKRRFKSLTTLSLTRYTQRNLPMNMGVTPPHAVDLDLCDPDAPSLLELQVHGMTLRLPERPIHREPQDSDHNGGLEDDSATEFTSVLSNIKKLSLHVCQVRTAKDPVVGVRTLCDWIPNAEVIELDDINFEVHTGRYGAGRIPAASWNARSMPRLHRYIERKVMFNGRTQGYRWTLDTPELQHLDIQPPPSLTLTDLTDQGLEVRKLVSLDLSKFVMEEADLLQILNQTKQLRFLNVSHCGLGDTFLQALEHKDGIDEQVLPCLEALSIANSAITGVAIRDLVNSRLPFDQRIPTLNSRTIEQPKRKSAFGPTSKRSQHNVTPLPSTSSSLKPTLQSQAGSSQVVGLDQTIFSTQPGSPSVRPSIKWLCIDECLEVKPEYITLLKKYVRYISWWLGAPNEERQKGQGRWAWDGEIDSCVDENPTEGKCFMKQYERGKWRVVHTCKKALTQGDEQGGQEAEPKRKGWSRSSQSSSSTLEGT